MQLPGSPAVGFFLAIWIIFQLAFVGVWDAYCLLIAASPQWTVSSYLSDWASRFPFGVLLVGIVIGHLIWPNDKTQS